MMMNLIKQAGLVLSGVLFLACGGAPAPAPAPAALADELDAAIRETSDYLNKQLPPGNKLVILNIQSDFPALSEYIIDELIANTVNDQVFSVVDRRQLDAIRAELNFQMSGEVDDETAQALGRLAGAQIIVSGAVSRIRDLYRMRVRALSVQSAEIEGQFNRNIPDNATIAALVESEATGYGGGGNYGGSGGGTAAASSAQAGSAKPGAVTASAPGAAPAPAQAVPAQAPAPAQAAQAVYNIGGAGPAGGTVFAPVVRKFTVPQTEAQVYKVGDTGPAGGIIFYVNPNAGDGWKYLEAAPARTETQSKWASEQIPTKDINNNRAVGTGKSNSEYIMQQAMQRGGGFGWAAQACDELEVNGFDDWFLPSRDELNMMWGALHRKGLGGFKGEWYWSSTATRDDGYRAVPQNFSDGNVNLQDSTRDWEKGNFYWETYRVRAVRQF